MYCRNLPIIITFVSKIIPSISDKVYRGINLFIFLFFLFSFFLEKEFAMYSIYFLIITIIYGLFRKSTLNFIEENKEIFFGKFLCFSWYVFLLTTCFIIIRWIIYVILY